MTDSSDPLAQLKDIHLPADISWWPLAPGWWLLIIVFLLLIAAAYAFNHFFIKKRAYRKAALQELEKLDASAMEPNVYVEAVAAIIRRTAISTEKNRSGSTRLAHLQGSEWQNYLQQAMPAEQATIIAISRYQPLQTLDKAALFNSAQQWVKGHKA